MPVIKGPIKITGGFNVRRFLEKELGEAKVKLPFKAKGWKSDKNSDLVEGGKSIKVKKKKK